MLSKRTIILPLALLLTVACATTPTISSLPFQESRSETIEKSGLRISTDLTAQKIKVQSADLELILPLADDWGLTSSSDRLLFGTSRELKMVVTVHAADWKGSAEDYLTITMQVIRREARRLGGKFTNERVISHGDDKILTYQIGDRTFFDVVRKAPTGRILCLKVSAMGSASRGEVAAIEKHVVETLVPSYVALK